MPQRRRAFARFMESDPEYTADICDLELSLIDKNGFAGFYRIRLVSLLRMEMSDRAARKKILILNGKAAVLGSEWENVRAILELLSDESFIDDEARERGEKTIVEAEALKPLSPALTGVMSAIIPGSGQALAGYPAGRYESAGDQCVGRRPFGLFALAGRFNRFAFV